MEIVRYLTGIPKKIPEGLVVVHNFRPGDPQRPPRRGGFRIFFARFVDDAERGPPCDCGWSWRGGIEHYEVPVRRKAREKARGKAKRAK